jgi:uncharacterized protein
MTSMFNKLVVSVSILITIVASAAIASTPEPPVIPRDHVTDLANVISSDVKTQLNALLLELEQKTTSQVLVLTVQSLDGQSIEEFAFNTKEKWKLGQKGKDNGVLIAVAVKDRKYRLEVGYGLEGVLPDSLVGTIGREYLVPYFRKGDYSTGIANATAAIIQTIARHEGVQLIGMSGVRSDHEISTGKPPGVFQIALIAIFVFLGLILCITHPQQCLLILFASSMGRGRGGWSGSGGGGGASGSW